MEFKDRIVEHPRRIKLTAVSGTTYDYEAVTGEVSEAGTPVNAENLNKLIQRDGDDIKDTVTTFTEASTRANIATGEKTSTIFGKIKKWFTDLKPHAFNDLATALGAETDKAPTNKLLNDTAALKANAANPMFTGVQISNGGLVGSYRLVPTGNSLNYYKFATITLGTSGATRLDGVISFHPYAADGYVESANISIACRAGVMQVNISGYTNSTLISRLGTLYATIDTDNNVSLYYKQGGIYTAPRLTITGGYTYSAVAYNFALTDTGSTNNPTTPSGGSASSFVYTDYKQFVNQSDISTVMPISSAAASNDKVLGEKVVYNEFALKAPLANPTFTGTVTVPTTPSGPSAAVSKSYVDELSTPYDKVIRTQTEFEELINSPNWRGATSVALVGQFTLSTANNSGIKVPATVKQIHGFNSAKITITNFVYNATTAKGGLWYDTAPTTNDYSIRDLEVDCTGAGPYGIGFTNCTNLTNCTGTGIGVDGYGFRSCTNLTNCTGTGTGESSGWGFHYCTNLTNCTGTGIGIDGYGFYNCTNLTNCTGTGTRTDGYGYGFYLIDYASNCRDGGSTTAMWGGTNTNIDLDTCCKTPVTADNTTLNT